VTGRRRSARSSRGVLEPHRPLGGIESAPLEAKLTKIDGKKAKVGNAERSAEVWPRSRMPVHRLVVDKKEVKRQPPHPYDEQASAGGLPLAPLFGKKTMSTAQRLYEGIELGSEGPVGLITYMRTDSVRIAAEAINEAREYIRNNYDPAFLPPRRRSSRSPGGPGRHEAIRPHRWPIRPRRSSSTRADQFRLYQLIWNRFLACQMNPALLDQTTVEIAAANCLFRAQGSS